MSKLLCQTADYNAMSGERGERDLCRLTSIFGLDTHIFLTPFKFVFQSKFLQEDISSGSCSS